MSELELEEIKQQLVKARTNFTSSLAPVKALVDKYRDHVGFYATFLNIEKSLHKELDNFYEQLKGIKK